MSSITVNSLCGDSTVQFINYQDNVILKYEDYDSDKTFEIIIETDTVYSMLGFKPVHPVFVKVLEACEYIKVDTVTTKYVAPEDSIELIKLCREGLHLLLGKQSSEWRYLFQVRDRGVLFACPVKSFSNIKISELIINND